MFCLLVSFPTQTLFPGWCANKSYVIATSDLWLFIDASNLLPSLPTLLPYTSFPVEFSTLSEKRCCVCVPGVECRGMYMEREGVGGGGGEAWESPLRGGAMGWVVEKTDQICCCWEYWLFNNSCIWMESGDWSACHSVCGVYICRGAVWGVEGKQVGSMDEEPQVRGCYNITFICTPTNQETVSVLEKTQANKTFRTWKQM